MHFLVENHIWEDIKSYHDAQVTKKSIKKIKQNKSSKKHGQKDADSL